MCEGKMNMPLRTLGRSALVCLILSFGLASLARAEAGFGIEALKKVQIDGWADLGTGGEAAARSAAISDGLRRAVETTAGVHVKSMLQQDSYSMYRNNAEDFGQKVTAKMTQDSAGFVDGYTLVKEGAEGKVYKVTLEVRVKDAALARELSVRAMEMAGARFPKLMFIVHEEYTGKDGKTATITQSTLQPMLEDALLSQGFDLVAQDQIAKIRSGEKQLFNSILTDDNVAAKLAMEYGAEYIVRAAADVKYTSFNDLGLNEYHAYTNISLSAVNASTGALVASKKEPGSSPPNCYSEIELQTKAVAHVGIPLLQNLMDRVLQSWRSETSKGVRYSVKVLGVSSYKKQALPFKNLVEKLDGVKQVNQVSFGDGRLELEVFFASALDTSKLQEAILTATTGNKIFDDLDARMVRGREINFEMK
jgi:hypothetical protein